MLDKHQPAFDEPTLVDAPRPMQGKKPNNTHLDDRKLPGYAGYIPGMHNHAFGAPYADTADKGVHLAKTYTCHKEGTSMPVQEHIRHASTGRGCIPGYGGYIPGLKNHVFGTRYADATMKASDVHHTLKRNPADLMSESSLLMSSSNGRDTNPLRSSAYRAHNEESQINHNMRATQ